MMHHLTVSVCIRLVSHSGQLLLLLSILGKLMLLKGYVKHKRKMEPFRLEALLAIVTKRNSCDVK